MTLSAGKHLGPYELLGPLGAGGMGEIYRARDTRLNRDVAVKVLPTEVSGDAWRLKRFEQEARSASALNHPNIITIYDIGSENGVSYIVMELVEGKTLRERLADGALTIRRLLQLAPQIADGLARAHEAGIVHRDLKPENVMVTKEGLVKILDFGLAKLTRAEPDGAGSLMETLTRGTEPGMVLGTVGYMSPEQAGGNPVDFRSDQFSFGSVLYEMATGRKAFHRKTAVETLSAILREEPEPIGAVNPEVPVPLRWIVERCLAKEPDDRYASSKDMARELATVRDRLSETSGPSPAVLPWRRSRRSILPVLGLAVGALVTGAIAGRMLWRPEQPSAGLVRVHRLTEFIGLEEFPALSRDGRSVAFTADVGGKRQLWVRLIAGGPALQITRDPADHLYPRWSRDSGSLLYVTPPIEGEEAGSLGEISALGGAPRRLAKSLSSADLSPVDDRLAFFRLSGRKVELVVGERDGSGLKAIAELETGYLYEAPRWSPDGRWIAYERRYHGSLYGIFVIRVGEKEPRQVMYGSAANGFAWLPDGSGIVFSSARGRTMIYLPAFQLWTVRLDDATPRQLTFGEASYTHPDMDRSGALVATRTRMRSDLWRFPVDGDGAENVSRAKPVTRQTAEVRTPSVSPSGREVVYVSDIGGHSNLWVTNLETGQTRQLTFGRDPNLMIGVPLWSPDSRRIAFYWDAGSEFGYSTIQPDGSGLRRIVSSGWWACWSPDGRWLYYQDQKDPKYLKKVPVEGGPSVIVRSERASMPALSPDGQTLYFAVEVPRPTGTIDYEIRSARPENAASRVLARIPAHRMPEFGLSHPVLSADGRRLALALAEGVATNIWAIATDDGTMRRVTDFGHRPIFISRRVSWSPDGRSIYAALSEGDADVVMIDGLRW